MQRKQGESPNVLFIMCDQLRHDWLGYRGAAHVQTPHIDRIAARGRVFTQATCSSPVCAPSRIGLASGVRPHRLGALDNNAHLPLSRKTYYAQLRDHGYHTGLVGKADLAKPFAYNTRRGNRPLAYAWGFTHPLECEGKMHAGRGDPPNGPYTDWLKRTEPDMHRAFIRDYRQRAADGWNINLHESVVPHGFCEDDFIGEKACRQLRQFLEGEVPWHLFVSFAGPHDPFDPAPEFARQVRAEAMPAAIPPRSGAYADIFKPAPHAYRDPAHVAEARRLYTAYLAQIDFQIGRLLDLLESSGQEKDTCVVFTADHGEMLGDHGRFTKAVPYESSLRIPMIVAGPQIQPGTSDSLVELIDLHPTLCAFVDVPPAEHIDARSFAPVLDNLTGGHREFAFSSLRGFHCIRTREHKAVFYDDRKSELFDLAGDPDEQTNLSQAAPHELARLRDTCMLEASGTPDCHP